MNIVRKKLTGQPETLASAVIRREPKKHEK
jgi:hypothetical protein